MFSPIVPWAVALAVRVQPVELDVSLRCRCRKQLDRRGVGACLQVRLVRNRRQHRPAPSLPSGRKMTSSALPSCQQHAKLRKAVGEFHAVDVIAAGADAPEIDRLHAPNAVNIACSSDAWRRIFAASGALIRS